MKNEVYLVRFIGTKNCFVFINECRLQKFYNLDLSIIVFEIKWGNSNVGYFSCSPLPLSGLDDNVMCISGVYAQELGISENEEVFVSLCTEVPSFARIHVSPVSADDYEVLALNNDVIQSSLLDQIRIVWRGQTVVIWVSSSFSISFNVDEVDPSLDFGKLESFTEVVVHFPDDSPDYVPNEDSIQHNMVDPTPQISYNDALDEADKSSTNTSLTNTNTKIQQSFISYMTSHFKSIFVNKQDGEIPKSKSSTLSEVSRFECKPMICRVHPMDTESLSVTVELKNLFDQPFNIYLHKENLLKLMPESAAVFYTCKVTKLIYEAPGAKRDSKSNLDNTKTAENIKPVYVHVCVIEDLTHEDVRDQLKQFDYSLHNCIYMNNHLRRLLNVEVGAKVELELVPTNKATGIVEIKLKSVLEWNEQFGKLEDLFRNHMIRSSIVMPYILNSDSIVQLPVNDSDTQNIFVKIASPDVHYISMTSLSTSTCKINFLDTLDASEIPFLHNIKIPEPVSNISFCSALNKMIEDSISLLKTTLFLESPYYTSDAFKHFNILLVGKSGTGKTTIAKSVCEELSKSPYHVHFHHVQCKCLKGKKVESVEKLMVQWLSACLYFQPTVILLDDLEVLVPSTQSTEQTMSAEEYHYRRLGERLVELLEEYQSAGHVAVIGTVSSLSKLNSSFLAPRGCHVFKSVLHIPELTKSDRLQQLEKIIERNKNISALGTDISLDDVAKQCDGYVIQDLIDLVDKAVFESWRKADSATKTKNNVELTMEDMRTALKNLVPLSLQGVDLFQSSPRTWEDLGGLSDVKQTLLEVLQWPSQYPELFENSPLRHQSGLLLYGAPGTGKTLLAGIVAHECSLKFISVKGPELLSKYIGASEEAVRNIFQKAQSAKPCILFFDEFDSLAPRRGHDSTGVTDRVVNQLLTQLDGVETLNGVWVMAATSRPDLLDPALLRPGRLDRAVCCPLPSYEDRISILQALSRKLNLSSDVNLNKIAENSAGFTGADLQAVMYTAQLMSITKENDIQESKGLNLPDLLPVKEDDLSQTHVAADNNRVLSISQAHLLAALQDTRPSLSVQEIQKYSNIYRRFMGTAPADKTPDFRGIAQRATLA